MVRRMPYRWVGPRACRKHGQSGRHTQEFGKKPRALRTSCSWRQSVRGPRWSYPQAADRGGDLLTLTEQPPMLVLWHLKASLRRKRHQVLGERLYGCGDGQVTPPRRARRPSQGIGANSNGLRSRKRYVWERCGQEAG